MLFRLFFLSVMCGLLSFSMTINAQTQSKPKKLADFSFYDLKGNVFTSKQLYYSNYLTVVYFDPTCEHCIEQTEQIVKNMSKFNKTKMLWVSIADPQSIADFQKKYFPTQKNVVFLHDKNLKIFNYFDGLDDTPTFVIYDKNRNHVSTMGVSSVAEIVKHYK